ncbi:MAG: hypothetical protein ACLQVA_01525 [Candidatus Brocadiia bacterium]
MPNVQRTHAARLRRAAIAGAVLFCLASLSFAGPIVTINLKDGRKLDADIQWFFEGRFVVRDMQSDETIELEASSIKTIDFGETHRESGPARPLTIAEIRLQAEKHRFPTLLRAFINLTAARLKELDTEIRQELDKPGLSADDKRDLGLARVLSLWAMGQEDNSRGLLARIRAEHPTDSVVKRFDVQMRSVKEWVAEPPLPPLPLPEKRP